MNMNMFVMTATKQLKDEYGSRDLPEETSLSIKPHLLLATNYKTNQ
jgi:hypothetical protein